MRIPEYIGRRWLTPSANRLFWLVMAAGLAIRLLILGQTGALGTTIVDEQHYAQLAGSIVAGDGFAWGPGAPTSMRPPLYPGVLAALWSITGLRNLQAVRIYQLALAAATAWLVFALGARVYNARVGRVAAAVCWLYPSLVFFNFLILTETQFTFLLTAFVLLSVTLVQRPRAATAMACGLVLGLAALTRSVLWPLPLVFCPLLALLLRGRHRLAVPLFVLATYGVVVVPWAVRNTRLQGVPTAVDTMGGLNLRMGNYEHTPTDRMWDAVALTGRENWGYALTQEFPGRKLTEGEKDRWAQAKAVEYIVSHPGTTLYRSVIKFADFWGLEREFVAGVQKGLFAPPFWFTVAASLCIFAALPVVALAGASGMWLSPPADWRTHVLMLMPVAVIVGVHVLAFGHSRYHLPLVPILAVYGAALAVQGTREARLRLRISAAVATGAVLCSVWAYQILVTDAQRIRAVIERAGF